jgi:hypothetical protein
MAAAEQMRTGLPPLGVVTTPLIEPGRGCFMVAKPGQGVPAGDPYLSGARVAREYLLPAGIDPSGIGARAKDHASRLQAGDAAVRRVAPVSNHRDLLGHARAGRRRQSRSSWHARPQRDCPKQILL